MIQLFLVNENGGRERGCQKKAGSVKFELSCIKRVALKYLRHDIEENIENHHYEELFHRLKGLSYKYLRYQQQ